VKATAEFQDTPRAEANKDDEEDDEEKETQAQELIRHASEAVLFHDAEQRGYATVSVNGHHETMSIRSSNFKRWIVRAFFRSRGKPPSTRALTDALGLIESRAIFDGPELSIYIRLGESEGKIYLDLCNRQWEVVEITSEGWRVLPSAEVPVKFRRARGMLALPHPEPGGNLDDLRICLGIPEGRQWRLLQGCLIMAFRPRGPYPVMCFHGEQGSGKSTRARIVRSLIDPNSVPLRCEPKEPRDLMITANNCWCIALDNVSHLSIWLSDALCRLATGGGFGTRELYTNDEEQLFDAMRPIILTGIEAVATRPDLLDRSMLFDLCPIPEDERKTEEELYQAWEKVRASVLGVLLDAVVCALKNFSSVRLPSLPRMADFAKWVTATEAALGWPQGTFMQDYLDSQADSNEVALEAHVIVEPLRQLMASQDQWEGKPSELLEKLSGFVTDTKRLEGWPKRANVLSGQLKRLAPNLRKAGIDVSFGSIGRGKSKGRRITIQANGAGDLSSPTSPSSPRPETECFGDDPDHNGDDVTWNGDDLSHLINAPENEPGDGGDDGDDLSPPSSNGAGHPIFVQLSDGRTTKVPDLRALPPDAVRWCHEGDKGWTPVDSSA